MPARARIERSAAVLFCLHPITHELFHVSANVQDALGYRAEELVGTADVWKRVRPRGCRSARGVLAAAIGARRSSFSVPMRVATRTGELRDVVISGRLHYDADGGAEEAVCVLVDLTAEMRASAAALESARRERKMAARMRAVSEAALGVVSANSPEELEAVLRRAARRVVEFDTLLLSIYHPAEHLLEFLGSEDAGVRAPPARVAVAGTPSERVIRDRRSLLTRSSGDPLGHGAHAIGTMRRSESAIRSPIIVDSVVRGVLSVLSYTPNQYDHHDVQVLEALAASAAGAIARLDQLRERAGAERGRERVLAILDASADFVAAFDPDQRTLYVNRGGRKLLGIPPAEPLDMLHFSAFTSAATAEMLRSRAIPTALRRGSWSGDGTLVTRERVEVPVHQTVTAHFAEDGSLAFVSTIARDMSTHLRLEQQLRQSQKMEAVGRLAGGIAHDFNNLLTAVTGHSALLLDALDPASALHREAEEIRRAAERAASLTRQLLAFSRQQVLRPVPMELNAVIEEMGGMLQRLIDSDVVLRISPEPAIGRVRADPAQIQQVVLNLVLNARDAMPGGGVLDVTTTSVELPHPDLPFPPAASPGRWNLLTVRDNGSGMDAETMNRIFEPFFSTREPGKGTGLGLPTVYGIVEQSGGFLDVQSRPGVGSTFRVFLPVCDDTGCAADAGFESAPPAPARLPADTTILLAEDDAAVRALARRVLAREGYNVIEAKDGNDALRLAAGFGGRIDLLLTDVVMPEAGGPELARRLTAERPDVKVVYTSGYTQDEAVRHGILQAAVPFLPKPFAPAALVALIRRTLAGKPPVQDFRP